jgi:signal transduction histidine kinase
MRRFAGTPLLGISDFGTSAADHYDRLERSGLTIERFMRLAGVHFIVGAFTAAAMLAAIPPTAEIGDAGWVAAGAMVVSGVLLGIYAIRTERFDPAYHLAAIYLTVAMVTVVVWLCGTVMAPFAVLFLLSAQHVAIHPPRRMIAAMLAIWVSILLPLAHPDLDDGTAAFALALLPVMTTIVIGVLYRLGSLYGDEAVARAEAARVRADAQLAQREADAARDAADRLRDLDSAKDRFVSTVSHELRTPLTSVKGYLEAILAGEAGELNPDQREYAEIVYRNSTRLQELVDDLLVLSRVDAGDLVLRRERFDLVDALRQVREEQGPRAAEGGLMLALDAPATLPVVADRRRIEQTIGNLVSNGIKYGADGYEVRIRAFADDHEVVIEVVDHGVGIPTTELSRIGERFFRASTAGEVQGSGLGLAISREIVARHGGSLEVESVEGSGSTFRVRLPTGESPTAEAQNPAGRGREAEQPAD